MVYNKQKDFSNEQGDTYSHIVSVYSFYIFIVAKPSVYGSRYFERADHQMQVAT